MGRQYNFYISPNEDLQFINFLFQEGYRIVVPHAYEQDNIIKYNHKLDNVEKYDNLDSFMCVQEQHLSGLEIYKESWGKLIETEQGFVDYERSPLIHYNRCFIHPQKKFLSSGRLYIRTYYKDEMENFDIINKEYQKLVRVMKKNIEYKEYEFSDSKSFPWASSQEAVNVINDGYEIG